MYIPVTFFGTQGSCFTTTTTSISGSGLITTGSFISGGIYWDYYQFEMSDIDDTTLTSFTASLNILSGSTGQGKLLVVGAGGSGVNAGSSYPFGAGGGGGGGVVYYNNFPISSGSFEIGIGKATAPAGQNSAGVLGQPSYVKLPNNSTYTPFTSSFITAYGGGGGALMVQGGVTNNLQVAIYSGSYSGTSQFGPYSTPLPAASGGGGGKFNTTGQTGVSPSYNGFGGLNSANQGNKGGDTESSGNDFSATAGAGGGGAGAAGDNVTKTMQAFGTRVTNGGAGLTFNLTGTPIVVGAGGGGVAQSQRGSKGSATWGSGGTSRIGSTDNLTIGYGGIVIITIPRCAAAFSCREFAITGSGAQASFLECNNQFTSSTTLTSGFDIVACLKVFSGSITPVVATGATYVALSQSCDTAFTSSNSGCTNCNTYRVTSDTNKISKVDYIPCNETSTTTTYVAGTFDLCVSGSTISVATGSASSLGTQCSVIGCDITPSNTNTPPCPCQALFVNVFSGRYDFDYTDCNGVTQRGSSSPSPFCGVPGSIRNGSCALGSCVGLNIRQSGTCCTYP
jgi:hypothetical protein